LRVDFTGSGQLGEVTLLQHSLMAAAKCAATPVVAVLGYDWGRIKYEVKDPAMYVVYNNEWQEGICSSIRAGTSAMLEISPGIKRAIYMVCDQPHISAELLDRIMRTHTHTGKGIVSSDYGSAIGTPVLFSRKYFSELSLLNGDSGAKSILRKYTDDMANVYFPLGSIDIDTMNDYQRLVRQ